MNSEQQPDLIIIESDSKENKGAQNESGPSTNTGGQF